MTKWLNIDDIKYFEIELSNYCNAKCPACIREYSAPETLNNGNISLEQIKKIINQIPNPKNLQFYFGGTSGDPMMNPEIVEIFSYSSEHVKAVSMDTNGSLRSTRVWKQIGEISKKTGACVIFSIDGLEDTNHIYRINTNWKLIMRNIKTYIDAGGHCDWKFLIFEHNQHQVEEAKQLAKQIGVTNFTTELSTRTGGNVKLVSVPKNKTRNFNLQNNNSTCIHCRSINIGYMYISSKLELFPCCYFHSPEEKSDAVKCDLNYMPLLDAINHTKYTSLANAWQSTQCPLTCKTYCNDNKYWEKIISSEKI